MCLCVTSSISVSHQVASSLCTVTNPCCTFIPFQLHGTRLPLRWTSVFHLPDVCVGWGCSFPGKRTCTLLFISPPPHPTPRAVCTNKDITALKSWAQNYDGCESLPNTYWFILFFADAHSLCWVTHGRHLFKKPSTWIYILTLRSPVFLLECQHNGERWVLEKHKELRKKTWICLSCNMEPFFPAKCHQVLLHN